MSGELLKMPGTHIIHGLEQLTRELGEDAQGIWTRLRFDDDFRRSVVGMLRQEDVLQAGVVYQIELNRALSRWQLSSQLRKNKNFTTLRDDLVEGLKRKDSFPSDLPVVSMMEVIVLYPHYAPTVEEAMAEIKRRKLVSLNAHEALSFAFHAAYDHRRPFREGVVTLGAVYRGPEMWGYLGFGVNGHGDPCAKLDQPVGAGQQFGMWTGFLTRRARPGEEV